MTTVSDFKENIYTYQRKTHPYIFEEWKWYNYRKFKANLYMIAAPYLAHFCMKVKIKPNTVTTVYAILGVLGGILLAVPAKWAVFIGIAIFYFRPFLDWTDGLLARVTKQASITGYVLDPYGGLTGWVALWGGLGLYLAWQTGEVIFFYLAPVIPLIYALNIMVFAQNILYNEFVTHKSGQTSEQQALVATDVKLSMVRHAVGFFEKVFESHTGFVDLICLLILLELILPVQITWIVYLIYLAWRIMFFIACYYVVARGGWVENELSRKQR